MSPLVATWRSLRNCRGHGAQKGAVQNYRGTEFVVDMLQKVKLELVVADDAVETVLATVHDALMELEAVRQRRAIEKAAFDNVWRGWDGWNA